MKIQTGPQPTPPRKLPKPGFPPLPSPHSGGKPEPPKPDPTLDCIKGSLWGLGTYTAATAFPSTYLHELGHKLAVNALYEGANPTIQVKPFRGGSTSWRATGLSPLGESLGASASRSAVAMAGTAMDALSSVALFASGYHVRKKHPVAGTAMMAYGAMTMANSTWYAASGIGKSAAANPGHDFLTLQSMTGIPCWASAALVASVLPLTYLALRGVDKLLESNP